MFQKLNKNFEPIIYIVTHGLKTFTGQAGQGIDYKKIWSPEADQLLTVIPEQYRDDFHLTIMTINTRIPPHTDTEIVTTINFYISTQDCRTQFFNARPGARTFQIANQTDGYIYDEEDLDPLDSFVAKPNEAWVLDVKEIHSVEPPPEFTVRRAITLGTHLHDYSAVCAMLKETGYL
jgi:hypothetical protein